jgi:hypothetical protein
MNRTGCSSHFQVAKLLSPHPSRDPYDPIFAFSIFWQRIVIWRRWFDLVGQFRRGQCFRCRFEQHRFRSTGRYAQLLTRDRHKRGRQLTAASSFFNVGVRGLITCHAFSGGFGCC